MHFYGLSDQQLLAMPLKRFWFLSRSIDRITAEEDTRMAHVAAMVQSGETLEDLLDRLRKQMGTVVDMDHAVTAQEEQLDSAGLASLRELGKVNQ